MNTTKTLLHALQPYETGNGAPDQWFPVVMVSAYDTVDLYDQLLIPTLSTIAAPDAGGTIRVIDSIAGNAVGRPTTELLPSFSVLSTQRANGSLYALPSVAADVAPGAAQECIPAQAINYLYDGAAYQRAYQLPDNSNGQPPLINGLQGVVARLQAVNTTTGNYDRLNLESSTAFVAPTALNVIQALDTISYGILTDGINAVLQYQIPDNANGQAPLINGLQGVVARLQAVNTTTGDYDRLTAQGDDADAQPVVNAGVLRTDAHGALFNESSYDRARGNTAVIALASAARVATTSSPDLVNYNSTGVDVVLDVTAVSGAPALTLDIEGKDVASGKYYPILTGAVVSTVSTNVYNVRPGITAAANQSASAQVPRTFRVTVTAGTADSCTYSVGVNICN